MHTTVDLNATVVVLDALTATLTRERRFVNYAARVSFLKNINSVISVCDILVFVVLSCINNMSGMKYINIADNAKARWEFVHRLDAAVTDNTV